MLLLLLLLWRVKDTVISNWKESTRMSRLDVEATAADWGSIPYHSTNYIADDPIPPASSPRIPIPRILLLLNLAYNACAMVHLIWVMLPQRHYL